MNQKEFEHWGDLHAQASNEMHIIAEMYDWKTVATWKHGRVMAILRCREQKGISLLEAKRTVDNHLSP